MFNFEFDFEKMRKQARDDPALFEENAKKTAEKFIASCPQKRQKKHGAFYKKVSKKIKNADKEKWLKLIKEYDAVAIYNDHIAILAYINSRPKRYHQLLKFYQFKLYDLLNVFDYESWKAHYKNDPSRAEILRKRLIDEFIHYAPSDTKKLEQLQWQIDMIRKKAKNPLHACELISNFMIGQISSDKGLLTQIPIFQEKMKAFSLDLNIQTGIISMKKVSPLKCLANLSSNKDGAKQKSKIPKKNITEFTVIK